MTFDERLAAWKARTPKPKRAPTSDYGRQPRMSPEQYTAWVEREGKARRARSAARVLLPRDGMR